MNRIRLAVLPGDGIGPEVVAEALRVLHDAAHAFGIEVRATEHLIGGAALTATGEPLPRATLDACLGSDAVLLGAVGTPEYDHEPPARRPEAGLLALRRALGGFANLRPARCYDPLVGQSPLAADRVRGADVLVVRELLGGLYYGEPRSVDLEAGRAVNTLPYTRPEIERVAHIAFAEARRRRRHVTSVDKANVLETSRLWRAVVTDVAREYPDVRLEHAYVDAFAMRLILEPRAFDVVLTENLFGDILSDEAAVLAGSLGLLPSATLGGPVALYEPVHGSAPALAGRGIANPIGAIACVSMLFRYTADRPDAAADVDEAIDHALSAGARTADLAGPRDTAIGTRGIGDAVEHALAEVLDRRRSYHAV
ncbi:MAG: 3-isopropylmalate dehydrogenase [Acidobacteriota bacterium]